METTWMAGYDYTVRKVHFYSDGEAPRETLPISDEISAISVNLLHWSQGNPGKIVKATISLVSPATGTGWTGWFSQKVAWVHLAETIRELHQVSTGFFSKSAFNWVLTQTATRDRWYIILLQYIVKKRYLFYIIVILTIQFSGWLYISWHSWKGLDLGMACCIHRRQPNILALLQDGPLSDQ